jgi:hypothetical protein
MPCPDELTLELWLGGALPPEEAAAVAAHVRACAACAVAEQAARARDAGLRAALALDADELAYLSTLDLAAPWRAEPAATPAWGGVVLAGVAVAYLTWLAAAPLFGPLVLTVAEVGLGVAPLPFALGLLFDLGQTLLELARNPALGLSQPLLALLALALLVWPRQLVPERRTSP